MYSFLNSPYHKGVQFFHSSQFLITQINNQSLTHFPTLYLPKCSIQAKRYSMTTKLDQEILDLFKAHIIQQEINTKELIFRLKNSYERVMYIKGTKLMQLNN